MVDTSKVAKFAAVGIGAIGLAAAMWYLSKEDDLDYKNEKYNLEAL